MVSCLPVTSEKIRAELWMGPTLVTKTPFIKSFSVNKSRNQTSNTFNVSFELLAGFSFPLGEMLTIKAGTRGNLKSIFTGMIEGTSVQPAFGKPSYLSVSLNGRGVLSKLENKRFSRRLRADGQGLYCMITGSVNRPSTLVSIDNKVSAGNRTIKTDSPNPAARGENSPLIIYSNTKASPASGGTLRDVAGRTSGGGGTGSGGDFRPHTHEDLDSGGPAFGVYSSD